MDEFLSRSKRTNYIHSRSYGPTTKIRTYESHESREGLQMGRGL